MTGGAPYFLSDPRPEDWHDPDDPRPEDWHDPDDPRPEDWHDPDDPRPEDWHDPDDPRPEDWHDPDDPRPEDWHDPDDPRPEDWHDPDDPRPEDWHDPDDPEVRQALQLLRRRRSKCGPRRRRPRCTPRRPRRKTFPFEFSGRLIVRLAPQLDLKSLPPVCNLRQAARLLQLPGLRRVLRQYRVEGSSTGRLVEVLEQRREGDEGSRDEGPYGKLDEEQQGRIDSSEARPSVWDLERQAAGSPLPPMHSLASYWRINDVTLPVDSGPEVGEVRLNGWVPSYGPAMRKLLGQLNELPEVDLAYRELAATDASAGAPGDTYECVQEYLERAPIGIDARWVWRQTGNMAPEVRFADLEQGWIRHDDLPSIDPESNRVFGDNRHGEGLYRGHHGTAVLGVVLAEENQFGVRGVSPGAEMVVLTSHWSNAEQASGNVANAIRQVIPHLQPGDILLLEVQRNYLPTEIDPADRDAIRLAVAHGIVVIEAAGNGNADLDRYVNEEGERVLSRRHPQFRDSGALMVGAARAELPHNRLSGRIGVGSNYGSRLDCFAHGDRVVTTGYGDMNGYLEDPSASEPATEQRAYSASFGGTSGAAPIIAGAALLVQGLRHARAHSRLSPLELRRLLAAPATGTRQGRRVRGPIGVMPDLKRILRDRLGLVSDLYLRSGFEDEGQVPVRNPIPTSPDIVVTRAGEQPPDPFDDAFEGLEELVDGQRYSLFVRMRNRGWQRAERPEVKIYWSPVATLVTPDTWHQIGGAPDPAVAGGAGGVGEMPVWSLGIPWPPEPGVSVPAPAAGRYCFTAVLRDGLDDEVVEPPSSWPYFDWRRYRSFLRWQNKVACCNVHRVAAGSPAILDFSVTGTPDRPRTFDFEIVRSLPLGPQGPGAPAGVTLELKAHAALAAQLRRSRLWAVPAGQPVGATQIRLVPPAQPRVLVEGVRLVAGAEIPCSLHVGAGTRSGHSLAIRQLYRGREVGRITWLFR